MTWDELTTLLKELARQLNARVNIVRAAEEELEAVFLHLPPAARFSSRKCTGTLHIEVHPQTEDRLVDTEHIPLAVLTPAFVRQRVEAAFVELVGRTMDAQHLKELFKQLPQPAEPRWRDVEGAG